MDEKLLKMGKALLKLKMEGKMLLTMLPDKKGGINEKVH